MCLFGKSTTLGNNSSIFGLLLKPEESFLCKDIDVEKRAVSEFPRQCLTAF